MEQFNGITVASIETVPGRRDRMANCICHCGTRFSAAASKVKSGHTKSCGCLKRAAGEAHFKTHGLKNRREYNVWCAMRDRCTNPNTKQYPNYGGRGIRVCDEWMVSVEAFLRDMGDCPKGLSLERVDTNGNYEPSNCRWATITEQNRNKRNSIMVTYRGVTKNLADLAEEVGLPYKKLRYRIKEGMAADVAVPMLLEAGSKQFRLKRTSSTT